MVAKSCGPRLANHMALDPVSCSRYDASRLADDKSAELDYKGRTYAERHALFMTGFSNILENEGLRSPGYYHDKSQCISFQDCSPAEMGIIKAERLKWGYVEPEELIEKLQKLKPSHNFTLRRYRHPKMSWDKTPIPETPRVRNFPKPHWFLDQQNSVYDLKRRLGDSLTEAYWDEARNHWDRVCDIELAPVPDNYLLRHINHSPSGTLFPRYLVKALQHLLNSTHKRGLQYYYDKYGLARQKREDTIRHWRVDHPGEVLADDTLSIYRTWPVELMACLDEVDQEAIREGNRFYMAELEITGQKMQELVMFWKNCGLVTGTRTPQSPQWPDPKAKLRGVYWPKYLGERLAAIYKEFGRSGNNEGEKRETIELARWKEAVLNTGSDPIISEVPLTQPLQQKLEIAWKDYESFLDAEFVQDAMIDVLGRWRRGEDEPRSGTSSPSEPDSDITMTCSRLSRSDTRALKDGSEFLREHPSDNCEPRDSEKKLTTIDAPWPKRLRPKSKPHDTLRQHLNPQESPRETSQRIAKSELSEPIVRQALSSSTGNVEVREEIAGSDHSLVVTPQIMPSGSTSKQMTEQDSSEQSKTSKEHAFVQGARKSLEASSKSSRKRRWSGSDENTRKLPRLLTPPSSK